MDLGRASFGGWELGPPSASEMAPDLEMLPAPQYIYPALQYLHKTAQYMRSGVHTIFAHAPICVLTIICSAGRAQDLAGGDSGAETDLGRSSSSVPRQDIGRHPAPGSHLLLPVANIIVFEKHCKVSRILPCFDIPHNYKDDHQNHHVGLIHKLHGTETGSEYLCLLVETKSCHWDMITLSH